MGSIYLDIQHLREQMTQQQIDSVMQKITTQAPIVPVSEDTIIGDLLSQADNKINSILLRAFDEDLLAQYYGIANEAELDYNSLLRDCSYTITKYLLYKRAWGSQEGKVETARLDYLMCIEELMDYVNGTRVLANVPNALHGLEDTGAKVVYSEPIEFMKTGDDGYWINY